MAPTRTAANDWGNFKPVSAAPRYRLICRDFGPEKSGKDHFCLTAPGPIAIQSFDIGLEGVVEKFLKPPLGPKEIVYTEYEFDPNETTQEDAQALWEVFVADYKKALTKARSVLWDTETEIWELARYAEFGEASDAPRNYVALNAKYRDLIQCAYDADVNLFLIQKVKERWNTVEVVDRQSGRKVEKPRASGLFEPTGFKEAGYIVQVNLRHFWEKENGFGIEILNCRQNMEIAGETYFNTDFASIAQLVFPDTDESDWE